MKIIVYDNCGHPFQVQLSRNLAKRGYDVLHLYSASFQTPKGALQKTDNDPTTFNVKGLILSEHFEKYSFIKRWKQDNQFGKIVVQKIKYYKPDVVIAANVPLDTLKHILKFCNRNSIKFIFWVQDFHSVAIKSFLEKKIPFFGGMISIFYRTLEKRLLESSDYIVLISNEFKNVLEHLNVSSINVAVIENWAPIDEMPVTNKINNWSIKKKLSDKFCFVYSGTLGLKHNPQLLLELALHFRNNDDVRIVVVSEGKGADWLKENKVRMSLHNLILLDFQPFSDFPNVLGTGDVLISILEKDAGIFSVPSKVLSYLCAQRAILLAVPRENLSAKIINLTESGYVVEPDDINTFLSTAGKLFENRALRNTMALNARKYAEETFQIDTISQKFELIIRNLDIQRAL